jgi:uncharacterized protein with von Willebrand factor type A (vWA) domain
MNLFVYSRWDGTRDKFSFDVDEGFRAVSELMMQGLRLSEALEWLRSHGFSAENLSFRVMGVEEHLDELRTELERLGSEYHLSDSLREVDERLEDILDRERAALVERHGHESAAINDFLGRRHAAGDRLRDRIERFQNYEFEDREAGEDFAELLGELDDVEALERFIDEDADRFRGPNAADYETAQRIRRQVEDLERLMSALARGDFTEISPEELARLLGDDAARSLVFLRDFERLLRERGYVADGSAGPELTARAVRKIGAHAIADVYGSLQKNRFGEHATSARGADLPRADETRPYAFGDALSIDVTRSVMNAVRRISASGAAASLPIALRCDDLEVRELDHNTDTTTVLLLDLSWSMSFEGRFPAAKRVALALQHLVRSAYPRDRFFVVGFSTRARELSPGDLPDVSWDSLDPFTNLQAGLRLAGEIIAKNPCTNAQVIVITDGQPTAYYADGELHAEWPLGPGSVSPRAVAETMREVAAITRRGVTINTFMIDDSPELVGFVERMTEKNRGRAFFTAPEKLGSFLLVDYVVSRRLRRR